VLPPIGFLSGPSNPCRESGFPGSHLTWNLPSLLVKHGPRSNCDRIEANAVFIASDAEHEQRGWDRAWRCSRRRMSIQSISRESGRRTRRVSGFAGKLPYDVDELVMVSPEDVSVQEVRFRPSITLVTWVPVLLHRGCASTIHSARLAAVSEGSGSKGKHW
jgi:hypothetical protein